MKRWRDGLTRLRVVFFTGKKQRQGESWCENERFRERSREISKKNASQTFFSIASNYFPLFLCILSSLAVKFAAPQKMSDGRKDRKAYGSETREVRADGKEGMRREGWPRSRYHGFFWGTGQ